MNKKVKIFVVSGLLILIISLPTYAQNQSILNITLQKIISTNTVSRVLGTVKGRVLSLASLQLSDEGDGVLGVYAETLCHESVREIYVVIYLEVWDAPTQDWEYVCDYEYKWLASDRPGVDLTNASVSFDIEGLPKGKTYSLRAYHTAQNFENVSEMMTTLTDGIELK